jgi:hypothetical protein
VNAWLLGLPNRGDGPCAPMMSVAISDGLASSVVTAVFADPGL